MNAHAVIRAERVSKTYADYAELKKNLGGLGASKRMAKEIHEALN